MKVIPPGTLFKKDLKDPKGKRMQRNVLRRQSCGCNDCGGIIRSTNL
jgi:hypothetical protein